MRSAPPGTIQSEASQDPQLTSRHRLDVQGLRAFAVLIVVAFHAGLPVPGGFVGVDIFFVISGFVITSMLAREWRETGGIRFRRFYWRRFKRLLPALAVMIACTLLLSSLLLSPFGAQQTAAKTGVGALFSSANLVIAESVGDYFDSPAEANPLLHTWSLSVEEQFYLIFPAILLLGFLAARRARTAWIPLIAVIVVAVLSMGFTSISYASLTPDLFVTGFYSPFTRAWEFAIGSILALALPHYRVRSRSKTLCIAWLGAGLLLLALWTLSDKTPTPGPWTTIPVAGAALVLLAGSSHPNAVSRALSSRPMVKVGDFSYSLYLWHWPLIAIAMITWPGQRLAPLLAAAASVAPALASYVWVERPLRMSTMVDRYKVLGLVSATIVPVLVLAGAMNLGTKLGWGIPAVHAVTFPQEPSSAGWIDCMTFQTKGGAAPLDGLPECNFNAQAHGRPIFLVGDSNAAQYQDGATAAAARLNRPLSVRAAAQCPFIDVRLRSGNEHSDAACRAFYETTLGDLTTKHPGTVILAEHSTYWWNDEQAVGSSRELATFDAVPRSAALEVGLLATVSKLKEAGHRVVLVMPLFDLGEKSQHLDPSSCSTLSLFRGRCPLIERVSDVDPRQLAARETVAKVGERTGSLVLDFRPDQCPNDYCGAYSGSSPIYLDAHHISVEFSRSLADDFTRVLENS